MPETHNDSDSLTAEQKAFIREQMRGVFEEVAQTAEAVAKEYQKAGRTIEGDTLLEFADLIRTNTETWYGRATD